MIPRARSQGSVVMKFTQIYGSKAVIMDVHPSRIWKILRLTCTCITLCLYYIDVLHWFTLSTQYLRSFQSVVKRKNHQLSAAA